MRLMSVVVVDLETNGPDITIHQAVEVAWHDMETGKHGYFIPSHHVNSALATADISSLRCNRYIDRIPGLEQDTDNSETIRLWRALDGNTLAGSNPRFDAAFLAKLFEQADCSRTEPCNYKLWDLAAYAAGVLGLEYLPGAFKICELLDLDVRPDHTAGGDVAAEVACFTELFKRAGIPRGDSDWINDSPIGTTLKVRETFNRKTFEYHIRRTEHGWGTVGEGDQARTSGYIWGSKALTELEVIGEETP